MTSTSEEQVVWSYQMSIVYEYLATTTVGVAELTIPVLGGHDSISLKRAAKGRGRVLPVALLTYIVLIIK